MFIKMLQNSKENICVRVPFLVRMIDSDTVVFMWILQNIEEHPYHRTPPEQLIYNKPSYSLAKD